MKALSRINGPVLVVLFASCSFCPPAFCAEILGWRMDGSGCYPDADPPTYWSKDDNIIWSAPFVQQDIFLIGNAALTCADAESLKILWTEEDEESFQADILHIVSHDRKTLVFSRDGHALVIEASREGCRILDKAKLSDATYVRPAISGNRLYARDESFLYCHELNPPW